MYLLFLDESGTHGGSPSLIVGGFAVQEDDARHLQQKLDSFLQRKLLALGLNSQEFELHATDMLRGKKEWAQVPLADRKRIMHGTYMSLLNYVVRWPDFPLSFFGAVVDSQKHPDRREREKLAYELVLNKFDNMLGRINRAHNARQRGLVIHDQRVVHGGRRVMTEERRIQEWTHDWREAAGKVGQLRNFADVPLFADSQATRLIQAADFVTYALWRHYGASDSAYLNLVAQRFMAHDRPAMDGLIHVSRDYATGSCTCPPCQDRFMRAAAAN